MTTRCWKRIGLTGLVCELPPDHDGPCDWPNAALVSPDARARIDAYHASLSEAEPPPWTQAEASTLAQKLLPGWSIRPIGQGLRFDAPDGAHDALEDWVDCGVGSDGSSRERLTAACELAKSRYAVRLEHQWHAHIATATATAPLFRHDTKPEPARPLQPGEPGWTYHTGIAPGGPVVGSAPGAVTRVPMPTCDRCGVATERFGTLCASCDKLHEPAEPELVKCSGCPAKLKPHQVAVRTTTVADGEPPGQAAWCAYCATREGLTGNGFNRAMELVALPLDARIAYAQPEPGELGEAWATPAWEEL